MVLSVGWGGSKVAHTSVAADRIRPLPSLRWLVLRLSRSLVRPTCRQQALPRAVPHYKPHITVSYARGLVSHIVTFAWRDMKERKIQAYTEQKLKHRQEVSAYSHLRHSYYPFRC